MSNTEVLKTITDEGVDYVDIRFTDPRGKLQHVTVMADQVDEDFLEEGFHVRRQLDRRLEVDRPVRHETDARHRKRLYRPVLCRENHVFALFGSRAGYRRTL